MGDVSVEESSMLELAIDRSISTLVARSLPEFPRHSEASIIEAEPGRLLLAWSRFSSRRKSGERSSGILESDNDAADIAGLWSTDGGETWHGEHTLVENSAGLNVMSPALARLRDGSLGLVYSHRESHERAFRVFARSVDGGRTWSGQRALTESGYVTGTHDRLTVLASGRIVVPLHFGDSWYTNHRNTLVAWSDDLGDSWSFSEPITLPAIPAAPESGGWEPGVTELFDGRLLLVLRTATGTLYRATSSDDGQTWSGLRSMEVISPIAPGLVRRIPGHSEMVLLWNWHFSLDEPMFGHRIRLSIGVSRDGGNSWPVRLRHILEEGEEYHCAYPGCSFVGDTGFITYYVARRSDPFGPRSLKLVRISLRYVESEREAGRTRGRDSL